MLNMITVSISAIRDSIYSQLPLWWFSLLGSLSFMICKRLTSDAGLEDKGADPDALVYAINIGNTYITWAMHNQPFLGLSLFENVL